MRENHRLSTEERLQKVKEEEKQRRQLVLDAACLELDLHTLLGCAFERPLLQDTLLQEIWINA